MLYKIIIPYLTSLMYVVQNYSTLFDVIMYVVQNYSTLFDVIIHVVQNYSTLFDVINVCCTEL